jgi:hypothetical protein
MPDSRVLIRLCSVAVGSLLMLAAHAPSDVWARGGGGGGGHGGGGHGHSTGSVNPSSHYTRGYYRQDGTYVQPHYQTNPNHTVTDNYSFEATSTRITGKWEQTDTHTIVRPLITRGQIVTARLVTPTRMPTLMLPVSGMAL